MLSKQGYLMIDNRCSGGSLFESGVATCSHCHAQVILHPLRKRERGYCQSCDRYICDACVGKECIPLNKVFDALQESASRRG